MADKKQEKETVNKFLKSELVASDKFVEHVDVLSAILEDDKTYSIEEVENIVDKFLKRKVN